MFGPPRIFVALYPAIVARITLGSSFDQSVQNMILQNNNSNDNRSVNNNRYDMV